MSYNLVYIATNIIFVYTIYLFVETFLGNDVYSLNVKKITYTLYFTFSTLIVLVTKVPAIMLIFNFISIIIISLNYKTTFIKKFMVTILICVIEIVLEVVIGVLFNYTDLNLLKDNEMDSIVFILIIRISGLILAYQLSRYKLSFKKSYEIPKVYYLGISFISLGSIYLFLNSLNNRNLDIISTTISGLILIIINVMMILLDEKIYMSIILAQEKEILNQQNIVYENQNNIINQTNETIKMLKHDMKNHINMLNMMCEENKKYELKQYTESILEQINSKTICNSNNFVIDSIVNFKLETVVDSNIQVEVTVPQTIDIMAIDITIILSNLLDNAIRGLQHSKDKNLYLKINCKLGNLIIELKNSYDGNLIVENGVFKTTKTCTKGHGLGLASVQETIKKYDGEMDIEYNCNEFKVIVIIPYID